MSGNMSAAGPHQGYDNSLQAALERVSPEAYRNAESVRGDMSEHASEYSETARNSELVTTWMDDVPLGQSMDITSEPWTHAVKQSLGQSLDCTSDSRIYVVKHGRLPVPSSTEATAKLITCRSFRSLCSTDLNNGLEGYVHDLTHAYPPILLM
jgi:hypothetical protein